MKRTNGVQAAFTAFLLRELQAGFELTVVVNIWKEAYPSLSIALHHRLASFIEACLYIMIGVAFFIGHIPK